MRWGDPERISQKTYTSKNRRGACAPLGSGRCAQKQRSLSLLFSLPAGGKTCTHRAFARLIWPDSRPTTEYPAPKAIFRERSRPGRRRGRPSHQRRRDVEQCGAATAQERYWCLARGNGSSGEGRPVRRPLRFVTKARRRPHWRPMLRPLCERRRRESNGVVKRSTRETNQWVDLKEVYT